MSEQAPTAVFGLPAYNGERHIAEALESLLGQTCRDLAIIVVDDCSSDGTQETVLRYAALDERIVYERNETRGGLVANWNRVAALARERFPDARYFAWASDHDVWHPSWLEALVGELDDHPEAVLAYPLAVRMTETGVEMPARDDTFDTAGIGDPLERFRRSIQQTTWGYRVYGLARTDALKRRGPFPLVLLPDRLFLTGLALEGEFRQVARRLWYRRYGASESMSLRRQRRAFFPQGPPLSARLPWWVAHAQALSDPRLARLYLSEAMRCELGATQRRLRRRRRKAARRLRAAVKARVLAAGSQSRRGTTPPVEDDAARLASLDALGRNELRVRDDTLVHYECLLALARAELLPAPADVVLHFGDALAYALKSLFPETVHVVVDTAERLDAAAGRLVRAFPERAADFRFISPDELPSIDLPISLAVAAGEDAHALARHAPRLHELGVPSIYGLVRGTPPPSLGASYWLRQVWVLPSGAGRPDPRAPAPVGEAPVPAHVVGRRRLVPEAAGDTVTGVARTEV